MADWTSALLNIGINVPLDKDEFSILCPFHDDTRSSCSINTDKEVWICFAGCGAGSLQAFVKKLGYDVDVEYDLNLFDEFYKVEEETDLEEVSLPEDFISNSYPSWIFDRGFDEETLFKWGCGTNKYDDLVIPIYDERSRLVGWVARRMNATPKYMYSYGLKKSALLFGGNRIKKSDYVCVVEGTLDAMWLDKHGHSSVALLGAHLSRKQEKANNYALTTLSSNVMVSIVDLPKQYKDVQEIKNEVTLNTIINNRNFW
jgi:hypothetical protein